MSQSLADLVSESTTRRGLLIGNNPIVADDVGQNDRQSTLGKLRESIAEAAKRLPLARQPPRPERLLGLKRSAA